MENSASKKDYKKLNEKFTVVFPASTVGRKGCYELREALRDTNVKLIVLGAELEGANFWRGIDREKGGDDWLEKADLVVLPAFVEHKPRRLLQAVANKIPVIASNACGVANVAGVTSIEIGDIEGLKNQIKMSRNQSRKTFTAETQRIRRESQSFSPRSSA